MKKSGRQHNSSTSQLRLDPFTIFLDENHQDNAHILRVFAERLTSGEQVIKHRDAGFKLGELDENWLPVVGRNGWILISADARIWRRSILRTVLFNAGVRGFFFVENTLRGETRAQIIDKALPEMRELVRTVPPPFVASITTEGHAHIRYTPELHKRVLKNEAKSKKRKAKKASKNKKRV